MFHDIIVTKENYIATVTLNRPQVKNALSIKMREEIGTAFESFKYDDEVRVVILTGSGGAFSAGGDIQDIMSVKGALGMRDFIHGTPLGDIRSITNLEKPVIAMVRGPAVGAACSMALACDLIIASETARFGVVFTRIGLGPDWGSSYFLPRRVGPARAKELFFTGKIIDASYAERIGLVNQMVPDQELEPTVNALAKQLAAGPTRAIGFTKILVAQGMEKDLNAMMEYECFAAGILAQTEDHQEGMKAFLEKRLPHFVGK